MACNEDKSEFYQLPSESLSTISKGDDLVLAVNFDARIGAKTISGMAHTGLMVWVN